MKETTTTLREMPRLCEWCKKCNRRDIARGCKLSDAELIELANGVLDDIDDARLRAVTQNFATQIRKSDERVAKYERAIERERENLEKLKTMKLLGEIRFENESSRVTRPLSRLLFNRTPEVVQVLFFARPDIGICIVKDGEQKWYDRVSQAVNALKGEKDEIECWAEIEEKE